ncbi:MAG: GNAT family N-acetyltransferase [Ignavibacteria bacterium]|nr:GNAT family N-acetyltransferase [Ignavibacteria bacterium]
MDVVRFEKKYTDKWEDFVNDASNGTIFHSRKFLSYHAPDKFIDCSLLFYEDNKLISVLPAIETKRDGIPALWSHMGASYGGFVHSENLSVKQAFDLTQSLIDFSLKEKFGKIVLTNVPLIYHKRFNQYIDFALIKNGFSYLKREVTSVITLNVSEDNVMKLIKPEARTSIRKSEKLGVVIKKSNDFDDYYKILKSNLAMRHNVQPAHTLEELYRLKELFPQKIHLFGAYFKNEMIAGVINFYCNDNTVLVFYISHNQEYQQYRAVNLLFYTIMKDAVSRGLKFLDFGLFTVNMEPNWGLGKFKESFGARGILRDSFFLDLK